MNRHTQSEQEISALLSDCGFFSSAECYDTITSTNDRAKELAACGAPQGTVVLSETQTNGRGRMGRHFYSPQGSGLYMSLILRPRASQADAGLLTACAAVSVWKAILKLTGVPVSIKWVNDLYYDNKKLCGILAEGQFDALGELDYVVLGIGINLRPPQKGYADEISGKTISLAELPLHNDVPEQLSLCVEIVKQWSLLYEALPETDFLHIYRDHSNILGKTIQFLKNGAVMTGLALSIDDCARLLIQRENGEIITLETGEVNLIRPVL